tara:strand:+ start:2075 stop:2620 length:546 start_codon:yes stop_codon:yes gene_type:complete
MSSLTTRMFRPRDRVRQKPPVIALLGDRLACLSELRDAPSVQDFANLHTVSGAHRGAVIGVDTTGYVTKKDLRQVLQDLEIQCAVLCGRLPHLRHIVVVVDGAADMPGNVLHRICESATNRIARRLDDAFKEVAITAILAELCDDPGLLADRVLARLRARELYAEAVTVQWRDIVSRPIAA